MPFRSYIKGERERAGFGIQKEFAKRAGFEHSWYSRIESGAALARPRDLDALTAILGVPAGRLYEPPFLRAIEYARRKAPEQV